MKKILSILAVLLCVFAVIFFFAGRQTSPVVSAQPAAPVVQPAPVTVKDRATQLQAVKTLQDHFLANGVDATVKMSDESDCKDEVKQFHLKGMDCAKQPVQMTIIYALASKVFAYQLSHEKNFLETLHQLGFTRLVLADGYHKHWIWYGDENGFSTEWTEDTY